MNNWLKYLALVGAVILLTTSPAHALSCAAPSMNATVYDNSAIIFEGMVKTKRELTRAERESLSKQGLMTKGGDMTNLRAYEFTVTTGWKNAQPGQEVTILRNTYWGDGFAGDRAYLVVARDYGGFFEAPLCGNTMPSQSAQAQIEFLTKHTAK